MSFLTIRLDWLEADFPSPLTTSMSGKTTYLTTIALISVQAMIGSFVPAEYASVPLHDALLTRLSNDDNLTGCVAMRVAAVRHRLTLLSLPSLEGR